MLRVESKEGTGRRLDEVLDLSIKRGIPGVAKINIDTR